MKGVLGLVLLLANVRLASCSCYKIGDTLLCWKIPAYYLPGCSELVITQRDVGQINSTVFHSDTLTSIISLSIRNASVTEITESAFSSLCNLTNLSLEGNLLSQVSPGWFADPAVLREFNLTGNRIEVVNESMFKGLMNLTHLRLNRNRIQTIHPNTFSSQTVLAELDLSENSMTRVSPQVFRTLRSTKIRLDGNPWDCSCDAADSVAAIKDLHSRSLLQRATDVTCETPINLRGQSVWNVSVCPTSPPPGTASQTNRPKTTHAPTTASFFTVQPKPTDTGRLSVSSFRPTDAPRTVSASTARSVTSPASQLTTKTEPSRPTTDNCDASPHCTVTSDPKSTNVPIEPSRVTESPSQPPNIVCTLIGVVVVLSVLLCVVCFLAMLRRRKRTNKTVRPGHPKEEKKKLEGDGDPGPSTEGDPEEAWRKSFPGGRAKSADAVILRSPFCASGRDLVTLQTETEGPAAGKQVEVDGIQAAARNLTTENDGKPADPLCPPVSADMVPYLSIGTNHPNEDSTEGHRAQRGRVMMGRISSWPPTAVQWQARCKLKEEEEGDRFSVWVQNERVLVEMRKIVNNMEPPPLSPPTGRKDDESSQIQSSKPNKTPSSFSTDEQLKKAERQTPYLSPNQDLKPAEKSPRKHSNKAEKRRQPQRAVTSRQKAVPGSKAPSGGASPDDETLPPGNENLLHEVVQNNGRWTRERWRQTHVKKQHR